MAEAVNDLTGASAAPWMMDEKENVLRIQAGQGLPKSRIVGLGIEANFWKQGTGLGVEEPIRKCGPNTEVFFDRGPELGCGSKCKPGCGCDRFVEFANTLFICWEIDDETQTLRPMADPFAETVIGTERVAMITQGKSSVFEIESIQPLIEHVRSFHQTADPLGSNEWVRSDRAIADHIRALLFLVADGAPPPGKGGRTRVMRKPAGG
jgi:alanyl-tRNA synthetase